VGADGHGPFNTRKDLQARAFVRRDGSLYYAADGLPVRKAEHRALMACDGRADGLSESAGYFIEHDSFMKNDAKRVPLLRCNDGLNAVLSILRLLTPSCSSKIMILQSIKT
jgi:hypothetical protein